MILKVVILKVGILTATDYSQSWPLVLVWVLEIKFGLDGETKGMRLCTHDPFMVQMCVWGERERFTHVRRISVTSQNTLC